MANFRKTAPVSTTAVFRNLQLNDNHNKQDDGYIDSNSIIDKANLVELMKSTICVNCRQRWDGKIQCRKREGLYECLEFICYYCHEAVKLPTSKQEPVTQRHVINIWCSIRCLSNWYWTYRFTKTMRIIEYSTTN